MAANAPAVGAGTGKWTIVSGAATIADATAPNTTVTVAAGNVVVLRWTISNGNCPSSTDDVTLINYQAPSQAAAGNDLFGCELPSFTLGATDPAVGTGVWTIVSGTATIANTALYNSAVTVPAGTTAVLRWTVSNGSPTCTSTTDDVSITNYQKPSPANAGADQSGCNVTFFDMAATAPTVGTGTWTVVSGTATILTPNSPTTRVNIVPGNTAVLRWAVSNGSPTCPPNTDGVQLTSYKLPTTADAGADQSHCNISTFTMAANAPAAGAGTGSWSIVSGTATIADPAAPNTTVTVAAGNTAVLRWTISNGGTVCTPSSDDVTLINYELPSAAVAGADQSDCDVTFFNMTATAPTVGTGVWTIVSGTATIVAPTSPTTRVNLTPGSAVVLRWTVSNGSPTCTPRTDDVTLISYKAPTTAAAGVDQNHCNVSAFTMAANAPVAGAGTGKWTIVSGSAIITNPAVPNTTVTVAAGNVAVLRWTITNGNCPPSSDDVTLINYQAPSQAAAGADQKGCEQTSFTLNAVAPAIGTGRWTVISGTATITDPTLRNSTVTVPVGTTAVLRWTVSNGSPTCASTSDDVSITNYRMPSASNAGPDNSGCNVTFFNMTATAPTVGTGVWTIVSGTATIVTPTSPTTRVNLTPGSTVVLRWTVSNGSPTCPPSADDVTLTSYKMPTTAVAGPDQSHCNNSTFTMAANTPAAGAGTGRWSIVSGTATIANPAAPNTTVTVAAGNTVVLRWTITNGLACTPSADDVTLVNYAMPTIANAGPDQKACNVTTFTLAANQPTIGTGRWTVVLGSATLSIANPALFNTTVTLAAGDSVILRWTVTNGTCAPSTDDVTLVSYRAPATAAAGADQQQCNNTAGFTMNANAPGATATGTWSIVSGTATITNINDPKTIVKIAPGVTATLRWTISNGVCMATTDDVTITNVALVMGNTISADQTVCLNEIPAALTGGTLSGGTGTYTYQWQSSTVSASTGFVNIATATNATYTPGVLAQDTWFRRIVTSGPCANNISNAVKITVVNKPPVVVFVPGPLTVDCEMGKDYTTLFGTPQFSHTPYTNMPLTVTFTDAHTINGCTQTFTRTWTATDKCGMSTTASQTITVVDTSAPVFTSTKPADVTVDCDKIPAAVTLTAMDNCMGALTVSPVETRQNIPGECANNYKLIRTWTATDGCSNSLTLTQVITVKDMTAPVFTMTPPRDTLVNCDAVPAAITLTATDNCTPGVINVTATDVRQSIPGSQCADNYQIIRTWIAMDVCGNKATVKQTITVQDTTRPTFSIPQPANVTVDCDKVPAWPVITANDNCSGNVKVVVGEQKLPTQPACPNNYRLVRTWTATDNCGNMASMQQIITVQDTTRPVFTVRPPADTTVDCDKVPPIATNVVATDACSGNVKLSRTQVREAIPGATCQSNYRLIRTWIATDECGNQAIWRQVVTVQDTTRPVIAPAPADITLTCGQPIPAAATLTATDNCDGSFPKPAAMREDPYVKDVCAGYTIIRRWNTKDGCGNQAIEVVQRITVMPCPKPELDPSLPMNCSDNPNFTLKLKTIVNNPTYTLISVVPANAVRVPLTQSTPVFNLNNATQASFIVTDGVTGCVSDTVTYSLQYNNKPMVNLGNDTTICGGNSLILDAGAANFAYTIRWSTGETTQRINVSTEGTYWVSVTNGICTTIDTIHVVVVPMPLVNIPDASICRGQSVKLDAFVDGGNYLWSTGETASSILVSTQEQFWVKVVKSGCITIDTVNVTVNPPPDFSLNRDTTICPDQSIMLTVNVTNGGSIRWATGATTSSIVVNEPGQYWVTISRDNCMVRDTVNVRLQPSITVDLGPDRQICPGSQISIDGTTKDALSYLWSDGDPNPVKVITAVGEYRLDVMDRFCQRIFSDSVRVMLAGMPEVNLGRDTVMCIGETLRLRADGKDFNRVLWSDGTTGPFINVTKPGTYSVTVFNDCGSSTDQITVDYTQCDPEPHFPNAFTPNGDGRNDVFRPVVRGPMYEYELRIFNRWGELIYLGRDQKKGWDGRYQGQPVSIGTYVWWLTYKKMPGGNPNVIKGEITVVK
ncbi:gliding motility-associated C-terminal domain-containing protein [Chitinophaga agrisoli]|nr:gliding motility-associated C-terminal domain-containing protein [Chitinophaga agrisoli]